MAAADIGANASSYQGNAGLGGGSFGSFQLDIKPVEDLARYTMLYNKSEYDQRQKNADEKIKEIAEATAFDPNGAIQRDKEAAMKIYNDLIAKATDYARQSPSTSEEKVKQNWEYKKEIAEAQKAINSIKGRAIAYNARMDAIKNNTAYTAEQKKQKIAELDKAADSDIYTPIALEDKFNETIPQIAAAVPRKIVVSSILDNNNVTHDITVVTSTDLLRQSQSEATGLESIFSGANKDFFAASSDPYKVFYDSATAYNTAISDPRYQTKDAGGNVTIDYDLIKRDNATLANVGALVDDYNKWASNMKVQAVDGVFTDRLGKSYKSIQGVSPDDFFTIDKTKPLTGDQMVMLEKWRKSSGKLLTTDEKVTPTDNAIQVKLEKMQQAGANYRAKLNENGANYRANLPYEKLKLAASTDAAKDFGNIIYGINGPITTISPSGKKSEIKIINGAVVMNNGAVDSGVNGDVQVAASALDNSIITEFNKYAGQARVNAEGVVISSPTPAKLKKGEGDKYTIRFENGVVTGILTEDGSYADVDQFQYITTQTSQKGTTKYKKPEDISGGTQNPKTANTETPEQRAIRIANGN